MSRRLHVGDDLGFGWALAAYRPGSEEVQADGSIVRHPPHLRAERRAGEAMNNLVADSESGILARPLSFAVDGGRRPRRSREWSKSCASRANDRYPGGHPPRRAGARGTPHWGTTSDRGTGAETKGSMMVLVYSESFETPHPVGGTPLARSEAWDPRRAAIEGAGLLRGSSR